MSITEATAGPATRPETRAAADASVPLHAVMWGTYDLGKPRTRILRKGLQDNVIVTECHADIWSGIEDKGNIGLARLAVTFLLKLLVAYPVLIARYLMLPRHDVVLVGYLGHLDVLVLWPFAKLRGVPVVWDAFLSLYDTVVIDRAKVSRKNPIAWVLFAWEWLACRAADLVLLDTKAHAAWFDDAYQLPAGRTDAVLVGAEGEAFAALPANERADGAPIRVLFYGQFIPLHGIEVIVAAAAASDPKEFHWTIIGTGQEAARIRTLLATRPAQNLEWIPWVPYSDLRFQIAKADICLGIFGESGKASRVIPNKAFQIIAAGRPLVTRDSPAMRELVGQGVSGVKLVEAGNADALLAGIRELARDLPSPEIFGESFNHLRERISPAAIGRELTARLKALTGARS